MSAQAIAVKQLSKMMPFLDDTGRFLALNGKGRTVELGAVLMGMSLSAPAPSIQLVTTPRR